MDQRFGKEYKLCLQRHINDVYETGTVLKSYPFTVRYKSIELASSKPFQLVISAPKRSFKRAHDRNRIRRLCKEAIRFNKGILEQPLTEHDQQIALFLIYTAREELQLELLERKTRKLFHAITQQLYPNDDNTQST